MIGQPQVYETLEQMGIPFDYYEHPEAPTIEIAAQFYRGEGTTLCKNLFFRNHKGQQINPCKSRTCGDFYLSTPQILMEH